MIIENEWPSLLIQGACTMEELLAKANELGLMIKGTELYKRLVDISGKIDRDEPAKALLEEYISVSEELHYKEQTGQPIEAEEKKKIKELSERAAQSDLIKEYIATQSYYMNLMMQIQKAISEPVGEPIAESRIIKPTEGGKIITDF